MGRRTIFTLSEQEYRKLKMLSTQEHVSMAEIMRRAIALYWAKVSEPDYRKILEKEYETMD